MEIFGRIRGLASTERGVQALVALWIALALVLIRLRISWVWLGYVLPAAIVAVLAIVWAFRRFRDGPSRKDNPSLRETIRQRPLVVILSSVSLLLVATYFSLPIWFGFGDRPWSQFGQSVWLLLLISTQGLHWARRHYQKRDLRKQEESLAFAGKIQ